MRDVPLLRRKSRPELLRTRWRRCGSPERVKFVPFVLIPLSLVRASLLVLFGLLLTGCTGSPDDPSSLERRQDTLARFQDGTPRMVTVSKGDSVLERRTYRPGGRLEQIEAGDSTRTFFDLHDPDSSGVFEDYLRGRWRNLSADTSQAQASAFYLFEPDQLVFENPSRVPIESLGVEYQDNRTLVTKNGMTVQADIASFDTVQVTGYTLIRLPPDSL